MPFARISPIVVPRSSTVHRTGRGDCGLRPSPTRTDTCGRSPARSRRPDPGTTQGGQMSGYEVARLDEIEELDDGREPFRPIRHHFGITSFGITAWTAREAGDRIINEHDESDPEPNEELYLVLR